jgi:hypothetical protein
MNRGVPDPLNFLEEGGEYECRSTGERVVIERFIYITTCLTRLKFTMTGVLVVHPDKTKEAFDFLAFKAEFRRLSEG